MTELSTDAVEVLEMFCERVGVGHRIDGVTPLMLSGASGLPEDRATDALIELENAGLLYVELGMRDGETVDTMMIYVFDPDDDDD